MLVLPGIISNNKLYPMNSHNKNCTIVHAGSTLARREKLAFSKMEKSLFQKLSYKKNIIILASLITRERKKREIFQVCKTCI